MPGRKPLPLDPVFIEVDETRVRCTVCSEFESADLLRTGSRAHLQTSKHLNNVRLLDERQQAEATRLSRMTSMYRPLRGPMPQYQPSIPPVRPSMFDTLSRPAADTPSPFDLPMPSLHDPFLPPIVESGMDIDRPVDVEARRLMLQRMAQELREQARHEAEFGTNPEEDDTEPYLPDELQDFTIFLDDNQGDDDEQGNSEEWKPYPNKTTMLLDIIDNLPRLRMSSNQLRIILWLLKECGVGQVPSYDKFRETQKAVNETCGATATEAHESSLGNRFFTNNIAQSISLDFANPEVACHMNFYPEDCGDGPIEEVWQAARWKEFSPEELTPMYSRGSKRFFIEELCQLDDGTFVVPHNWIMREKKLHADCSEVVFMAAHGWAIAEGPYRRVLATKFAWTYDDIVSRIGNSPTWEKNRPAVPPMPNPLRERAPDHDQYVVMVPIWADDVSGNRSKQYNKHMNMYMANSNLPGRLLQQEYFVRFVSTSPHASSPEQFAAVRDQINATKESPIICFNAATKRECAVILRCPALPADNPQQAEEASHMGGNSNCPCRKCKVGGTFAVKATDEGYHVHHYVGIARSASEIKHELQKQLDAAMTGVKTRVTELQSATGTKDKVTQRWIDILITKACEMKKKRRHTIDEIVGTLRKWLAEQPGDKMNPLLSIAGLDPSQDTPVEILHTVLLGIVKYAWYTLHSSWSEDERTLFTVRLQSTDISGLTIAPIRAAYMMQYRNNLIGKDFKTLMQTCAFHVHDISEATGKHPDRFTLVKAIGELGAVLWQHKIDSMDQYLSDLEVLVGNVLDAFDIVDCKKIIYKIKIHMLPHLIDDVRRFGPAIRNSTEVFECFNAIFRLCSVLSNHRAPSRDIAHKFSSMDRVKHILSGGYWREGGVWVQAGKGVRGVLLSKPTIQRHLGWVPSPKSRVGEVLPEAKAIGLKSWSKTACSMHAKSSRFAAGSMWRGAVAVIAQLGDVCKPGSWVFAEADEENCKQVGRIKEILLPADSGTHHDAIVLLERFEIGQNRHPDFGIPVLGRPADERDRFIQLEPSKIIFIFSAQHDCRTLGCEATRQVAEYQERHETTRHQLRLHHEDDDHFLVNIYAIHNAEALRKALPRELTKPVPLYEDRRAHHDEAAAKFRAVQTASRLKTAERRIAAKKAKADLEDSTDSDEEDISADNSSDGAYDDDDDEDSDDCGGRASGREDSHSDSDTDMDGAIDRPSDRRPARKRRRTGRT
ncbi:hypothetical protein FB107DRAFT_271880 [Schizophyllum commune]